MNVPGHIYILTNPSIPGLVKIGKSTRAPESRAKELSQATGVPTPFYLAFSIAVPDCHAAEDHIFARLECIGIKRTANREFFEMPLRKAIEELMRAEAAFADHGNNLIAGSSEELDWEEGTDIANSYEEHPGAAVFEKAVNAYYGFGDELEDKREAYRLLNQAKALGYGPAYTSLAEVLVEDAEDRRSDDDFVGQSKSYSQAIDLLKEGASQGHGRCLVKMADIFLLTGQFENATKCWKKFFSSDTFVQDSDRQWGLCSGIGRTDQNGKQKLDYACKYLNDTFMNGLPENMAVMDMLKPFKHEILDLIRGNISCYLPGKQPNSIQSEQQLLDFVETTL